MKIISYGALCAICLAQAALARAELSFHLNTSSTNIESNPPSVSKPAYPKYASVSFLQSDSKLDFKSGEIDVKTQCASMGYVIPVSKCTGAMKPSRLCSAESSMKSVAGADGYTTGCCNSNLYTALSPDACANNSTSLNDSCYYDGSKKYRCSCDRARYPYSNSDNTTCGLGGEFDVSDVCVAPNAQGQDISYYSGCCPNSYQECDANNHEVGLGKSCRVQSSKGVVNRYESCTCASHYDTVCSDGKLINVDNVCKRNGLNYTTESNCESLCTKTSETNIDDYLYGNVWHCLYENDGATLKETDEELKGKLCDAPSALGSMLGVETEKAYETCYYQGYTKKIEDCYNTEAVVRCPTDSSRVWCLEGRYCTGYNVGAQACLTGRTANAGANVEICTSSTADKGIRCRYKSDDCNAAWNEGTFNASKFVNYDASDKGDSNHCCKLGYVMNDKGICVANECDRTLYPYEQNPNDDLGIIEKCYEADEEEPLGYKLYFGFSSCNDDPASGGMWLQDEDNPRRCVCARKGENGRSYYLPFDLDLFFGANEAAPYGFNQGRYGKSQSCTDAEGSYYGYTECYVSEKLGTTESTKGMCIYTDYSSDYDVYTYPPEERGIINHLNEILAANGNSEIKKTDSIIDTVKGEENKDNLYCINYNMHCQNNIDAGVNPNSDDVCKMSYNPSNGKKCATGKDEDCAVCYHLSNLKTDADGNPIKENGRYVVDPKNLGLRVKTAYHGRRLNFGFEKCPSGYLGGLLSNGFGTCFKFCDKNNLSKCYLGDIVVDGNNSNKVLGIVWRKTNSQVYIYGQSIYATYDDGVKYVAGYQPAGNTAADYGVGKWHMPRYDEVSGTNLPRYIQNLLRGPGQYLSYGSIDGFWVVGNEDGDYAHIRDCCDSNSDIVKYSKTRQWKVFPLITMSIGG